DEQGTLQRSSWFAQLESSLGSVYLPWERWLMQHPRCKAVFPRDPLTAAVLKRWHIPAFDLGNPMMDGLDPQGMKFQADDDRLTLCLLPGSRTPEAYENWQTILQAAAGVQQAFTPQKLLFLAAIAPGLDLGLLQQRLKAQGWQFLNDSPAPTWTQGTATLVLTSAFNDCLHQADLAIAMSGTATEQFVGLGKPAITLPGKGPQFTFAFAEAQTRLLGISVVLATSPAAVAQEVQLLLHNAPRLQQIRQNGERRMGRAGAAQRIATCLHQVLGSEGIQKGEN
ncbi:MAG TPA: lipid-A-disaccharide synthase-related protein, partial [Coleofasciculaceae cyanobacterium]